MMVFSHLILCEFDWQNIAGRFIDVLGQADRPDCVYLD